MMDNIVQPVSTGARKAGHVARKTELHDHHHRHPDPLLKRHAEGQNVLVCAICDDVAQDTIRSKFHHTFRRKCVKSFIESFQGTGSKPDCLKCHIILSIDLEQPETEQDELLVRKSSIINRIKVENWTSSTKIEMLVYNLYNLRSSKQTHKSVVFSQFTPMLQLIEGVFTQLVSRLSCLTES
ncbi:MAG: DNA repair protein rad16 [Geoglossum umbratile]|nr:MAG: DNA repair protein rad16 [Geoglossum umbratile]